jgi:hypothetical protein
MARSRRRLAVLAATLATVLAAAVPAAALRSLHVDALSMRADRTRLHVGDVFHMAIHARVRERVAALDELVIPDVGGMLLEGDERSVTSAPGSTDVVETLTLEPTRPGTYTFAAAYLDAVDARTGKPSRFSSNTVRVVVEGGPASRSGGADGMLAGAIIAAKWTLVAAIVVLLVPIVAIAAFIIAGRRRRSRTAPAPVPAPSAVAAPPAPPRTPREDVADALRAYRVAPSIGALMPLRAALFAAAGVTSGATLRDALAATSNADLRAALGAAERTAFGPAAARDASSAELIGATEAWLR